MKQNFRKLFAVLIFWYFFIKKKVQRNIFSNSFAEHVSFAAFLEFIPMEIGI
jgi:hypothetical protein